MDEKDLKNTAKLIAEMIREENKEFILAPEEVFQLREMLKSDMEAKIDEMHSAFFKPSGRGNTTLLQDLHDVVYLYKQASWITKAVIWLVPMAAVLLGSWDTIVAWIKSLGGTP